MKYAFARDFLHGKGIKLYMDGKQILTPIHSPTKYNNINTGFWTGSGGSVERNIISVDTPGKLKDIGYGIVSVTPDKKFKKKQRVQYVIAKLNQTGISYLKNMPDNHYVQYDLANKQLRLFGPNAGPNKVGDWVKMVRKQPDRKIEYRTLLDKLQHKERIQKDFKHSLFMTQKTEFMEIPELAFMMAEDGGIVCIPRSGPGLKLRDEPRIGIWGIPGIGKTYLIHSIICRAFWKLGWDIHVGILNDRQRETGGWPEPNYGMEVELANLNEKPMPMPMVYLHPNTENPGKIIHEGQGVGHKISLPWDEMILNSGKYFDKLAGTEKYFEQRESKFLELEKPTREDFMEVFKSSEEKLDIMKPPLGSIRKMRALLDQLYSRKIVDIWTGIASKWLLKTNGHSEEYNPFTACLVAGLVPVLVTQNLLKKGYFPQYFQFYANDIFDRHVEDPNFKKIRTWLVIDEILSICKRRKETSASEALENLQTEGRQRRIGTLVATQNYTKVHDRIKTNCNYIICFGTPEASKICNDYSLGKFDADRTRTLSKFECMAYTYDYFVVYDSDGVRTKQKGPIYGKALHPLSEHEAPT